MQGASSTLPSPARAGTSSSSASTAFAATAIMAPHQDDSALLDRLAEDLTFTLDRKAGLSKTYGLLLLVSVEGVEPETVLFLGVGRFPVQANIEVKATPSNIVCMTHEKRDMKGPDIAAPSSFLKEDSAKDVELKEKQDISQLLQTL
ncbi:unnamed protein product [Sphagnum compactum]